MKEQPSAYDTLKWSEETIEKTKNLQDICLDHIEESDEYVALIERLNQVQAELEDLSAECKKIFC